MLPGADYDRLAAFLGIVTSGRILRYYLQLSPMHDDVIVDLDTPPYTPSPAQPIASPLLPNYMCICFGAADRTL
jgi:hypothetical protein